MNKKVATSEFGKALEKAAFHLVGRIIGEKELGEDNQIQGNSIEIEQETAAFKALCGYHALANKLTPEDDPKGGFGGYADQIASIGRGNGTGHAGAGKDSSEHEF